MHLEEQYIGVKFLYAGKAWVKRQRHEWHLHSTCPETNISNIRYHTFMHDVLINKCNNNM